MNENLALYKICKILLATISIFLVSSKSETDDKIISSWFHVFYSGGFTLKGWGSLRLQKSLIS